MRLLEDRPELSVGHLHERTWRVGAALGALNNVAALRECMFQAIELKWFWVISNHQPKPGITCVMCLMGKAKNKCKCTTAKGESGALCVCSAMPFVVPVSARRKCQLISL